MKSNEIMFINKKKWCYELKYLENQAIPLSNKILLYLSLQ